MNIRSTFKFEDPHINIFSRRDDVSTPTSDSVASTSDLSNEVLKTDDYKYMAMLKLSQVLKRELKSQKQSEVAKACGISKSLLNDWLAARRLPSAKNLPHLLKLANYLGLTLEQLVFDQNPKEINTIASTRFSDGGIEYRVNIEKVK